MSKQEFKKVIQEISFDQLLNIAAKIIVALDENGDIVMLNDTGHKLLGYKKNQLIGKNWFDNCIPEEIRENIRDIFDQLMQGKIVNVDEHENKIVDKSGNERVILWHNTIIKNQKNEIIGTLSSGSDITELKNIEKELQKHQMQLEELVKERTIELENKNKELERLNKLFVGREFRIKELKEKIKKLEKET